MYGKLFELSIKIKDFISDLGPDLNDDDCIAKWTEFCIKDFLVCPHDYISSTIKLHQYFDLSCLQ